jgi:Glycosyltransferase sugar-binding region containing DXD motif
VIPNRIHFIFGLEPSFGGKPFSFVHYLAILSAQIANRPDEIVLHHAHEPDGEWWERAKPLVRLNRVRAPTSVFGQGIVHYAHKADVLRLEILSSEGGIYLDIDTLCIRSFSPLLGHSTVIGIEPNAGLCNAVILAERNAPFVNMWLKAYHDFKSDDWRSHSVRLPYYMAKAHPEWIHVESEYSFFFPTYDDPLNLLLWQSEFGLWGRARGLWKAIVNVPYYATGDWPVRIGHYLRAPFLSRNRYLARLRRSYCLHLWESLWWEEHLKDLTPDVLLQSGGIYASLVSEIRSGA